MGRGERGDIPAIPGQGEGRQRLAQTGPGEAGVRKEVIGIEIEPKYYAIACERIENAQRQERLFA